MRWRVLAGDCMAQLTRGCVSKQRFPDRPDDAPAVAAARWLTWLWMFGVVTVGATSDVDETIAADMSGTGTAFRQPVGAWICRRSRLSQLLIGGWSMRNAMTSSAVSTEPIIVP